jgi:hypothetical protein
MTSSPYSLDEITIRARAASGLASHPSEARFVALAVKFDDPLADLARTVERQVFEESFELDDATMRTEYGPYEQISLFFLVLDRETGMPAGAARVIDGGGKTLDDAPQLIGVDLSDIAARHDLYDGKIWDFATLAVLPSYRGGKSGLAVSSLLYRTFINAGKRAGVRHLVAMLDHRAYGSIMLLGTPFETMAGSEPFPYLGSPQNRALYAPFARVEPAIAEQSTRLANVAGGHAGEIEERGIKKLVARRIASRVAHQVATGEGLDEHVAMPALERRRIRGRRP